MVRLARFLPVPIVAGLLLLAAPAIAATTKVPVRDDYFGNDPSSTFLTVPINPGDTVEWDWKNTIDPHTVTSTPSNQVIRLSSGEHSGNFVYSKTFTRRGRFTFHCQVHPFTMRGAVEVGPPPFPDILYPVLRRLRAHPRSHRVKLTFRLSERARVRVVLRGPKDKTFSRVRDKGKRSITIRHLPLGRYRATLRPKDAAGNRGPRKRVRFRISF
jgi:plastocyanin